MFRLYKHPMKEKQMWIKFYWIEREKKKPISIDGFIGIQRKKNHQIWSVYQTHFFAFYFAFSGIIYDDLAKNTE